MMMEFKQVMKRITCRLCHYTGDYDLMKGDSNPNDWTGAIVVLCKQCRRPMRVRRPDEMDTIEEVE